MKIGATAFAAALAGVLVVPDAARAQVGCFHDPSAPFPDYYGCDESATSTAAVGQNLGAIGEGFVQQQLNVSAGIAGFAAPTGRLRHTRHDGLREKLSGVKTGSFDTDESSVFGNVSYDLPGTWFGGKVRVNGLVGYGHLQQDSDVRGLLGFSTEIDSVFYGGSYLWSQGSFYSMSLLLGLSGDADGTAVGGENFSYDLTGYYTNSVVGYTFTLPSTYKFDLRAGLGHYDISTNRFLAPDARLVGTTLEGSRLKASAEGWNASLTGTLFTLAEVDGGVMRPYILGSYKNVFDEDIDVTGVFEGSYEQANHYGRAEFGFDYVKDMLTYGAAAYTEFSADENTFGGRLGVSVKLN